MPNVKMQKGGALEIPGSQKADLSNRIMTICALAMVLFIVLALLDFTGGLNLPFEWIDWIMFGIMALVGPFGFYRSAKIKKIKQIEDRLPDFLRDVAEAGRFGMTLAEAIIVASSGRYGSLTPEIKKMAAQIEWGVPANEALRLFSERVKTPLVQRMMSIVMKSSDAGGNVADVLTMVAHDSREAILTETEKGITMSTYVAVIYISFFVFLATIIILQASFLPEMEFAGKQLNSALAGLDQAQLGSVSKLDVSVIPGVEFAFLISAIAHAVGDGIMAGVLQKGSIPMGMRHAFIMMIVTFLSLRVLLAPGGGEEETAAAAKALIGALIP
jgi:flagellar protein FlaJ